ncbi:AmmeMemoRadiSam system radical SAM enzyme [Candidatus Oleimmundimicrobium sp.]|uniref:AmmeMemoRadiSam system radical SAM enzyme n=1 Tax=Candidatus Oleimmundimicrobium sp. TaxID=3060597 RepID=UPI00271B3807|nr:AmmeMemoRadiSam system radical SAM enzyme [Candidatus Oleimmundimicrobium sp.]MDO8885902.1 AmmeMemoRadiSam system radical SAM enzyme [Candidatus Oleimmundimicrobium sp.]
MEARFYEKKPNKKVKCFLCPHGCLISPGKTGTCSIRKNIDGTLIALTYERISSCSLDPIEKKPLYHFHPKTVILSLGSIGCNLACPFCQNWQIAQPQEAFPGEDMEKIVSRVTDPLTSKQAVDLALTHRQNGNIGLAYTYNEPFVWYEYIYETAKLAHENGLKNVLVTNGYVNEKPLKKLLPYIDAMNIDVKGFSDEVYKKLGGRLVPVLKTVEIASKECHVELTNLIVPKLNDSKEEIEKLVEWIATKVGEETPLHFSRYFPHLKYTEPPTPLKTVKMAEEIALKKLKYVHLGNVY